MKADGVYASGAMAEETYTLIRQAQAGDTNALNLLYTRYGERIHAIVRLRLGPRLRRKLESCDIVQSALMASVRSLKEFRYLWLDRS